MSRAELVITAITTEGLSKAEAARRYGLSEAWVSHLMARYRAEGTDWSLWLGIGLIITAVISSAMTKKVPWTREASVWLYSMAATACFAVHWAAVPA